jgi:hypothetical protein
MRALARMVVIGWPGFGANRCFGRFAGYEEVNDAGRQCRDPAMRSAVGDQGIPAAPNRPARWAAWRRSG